MIDFSLIFKGVHGILKMAPALIAKMENKASGKSELELIQQAYNEHGYKFDKKFNMGAIRNDSNPNTWNDLFFTISGDEVNVYRCTTDPGHWTKKQRKRYGIGWRGKYTLGYHKGLFKLHSTSKYPKCFAQAKKAKVFDVDNDRVINYGYDMFIHGQEIQDRKTVTIASAGCIVIKKPGAIDNVYEDAKATGRDVFDFALFDINKLDLRGVCDVI